MKVRLTRKRHEILELWIAAQPAPLSVTDAFVALALERLAQIERQRTTLAPAPLNPSYFVRSAGSGAPDDWVAEINQIDEGELVRLAES